MGTRNLTCVVSGGEYKLAQYGQWDGYPGGQGLTALCFAREWLCDELLIDVFRLKLDSVRFATEDEQKRLWADIGATGEFVSMKQSDEMDKRHPYFSRDNGAGILEMVRKSSGEVLTRNDIEFASDSLFCEWAYVIDLDRRVLEAYRGFNTKPVPAGERFAEFPRRPTRDGANSDYYPIRLAGTWPLNALPSDDAFQKELDPEEEDDSHGTESAESAS